MACKTWDGSAAEGRRGLKDSDGLPICLRTMALPIHEPGRVPGARPMAIATMAPDRSLEPLFAVPEGDDRSSHANRQLIGYLGMSLPILLWLIAAWRPTGLLPRWAHLDSVSSYYYSGAVTVFVGILIALAVFLFTYQGYANPHQRRDRVAAIVAGTAATLVAFFPTDVPSGLPAPSWWRPWMGWTHGVSATILFLSFIFFSLFQFPRSSGDRQALQPSKRVRNGIYFCCGGAMVICVLWAGIAEFARAPIFWPEALALEFFAASWLVKGRAGSTLRVVGRRAMHRVSDLGRAMRGSRP